MDSDYDYDCSDDGYSTSDSGNECKEKLSDNEDDDIAIEEEDQDSPQASAGNVLTRDEVQQDMNDMIKEATDITGISPGAIWILLNHYKWNMENLLEKLYECSNPDTFLQRARVNPDPAKLGEGKERREAECDICCSYKYSLKTHKQFAALLAHTRVHVVPRVTSDTTRAVECSCKCRFCFECGKEWHEPMDCALLRKWLEKCVDDSETYKWISANTKDCPTCHTTIEKNGGCNHMTCKSPACMYEFCWICMNDWKAHKDANNCSRYVESDTVKDSRAALEKYLHYYNRYMNHQNSLKLENKLYDSVRAKMDLMQRVSTMSWVEVQFLPKAVDVLSECRRTLMFAYAFAYYVKQGYELFIFEDHQRVLEVATEQLSRFLEQDLDKILQTENMVTLKQKVEDKYRYVEHRRNVLLNHCTEGAERDAWQFNNY